MENNLVYIWRFKKYSIIKIVVFTDISNHTVQFVHAHVLPPVLEFHALR